MLLVVDVASMLHVAQASVKIDKVLLHLVHALGEVGGEDLESYTFSSTGMLLLLSAMES